jgi:hypothetical protein
MDKRSKKFTKKERQGVWIQKPNIAGNQQFLLSLDDQLKKLPKMDFDKRSSIIEKYKNLDVPMAFLSPIYFALAIYFIDNNIETIDDDFLDNIVSTLLPYVNDDDKKLRRKIAVFRYVRLLYSYNSQL